MASEDHLTWVTWSLEEVHVSSYELSEDSHCQHLADGARALKTPFFKTQLFRGAWRRVRARFGPLDNFNGPDLFGMLWFPCYHVTFYSLNSSFIYTYKVVLEPFSCCNSESMCILLRISVYIFLPMSVHAPGSPQNRRGLKARSAAFDKHSESSTRLRVTVPILAAK